MSLSNAPQRPPPPPPLSYTLHQHPLPNPLIDHTPPPPQLSNPTQTLCHSDDRPAALLAGHAHVVVDGGAEGGETRAAERGGLRARLGGQRAARQAARRDAVCQVVARAELWVEGLVRVGVGVGGVGLGGFGDGEFVVLRGSVH